VLGLWGRPLRGQLQLQGLSGDAGDGMIPVFSGIVDGKGRMKLDDPPALARHIATLTNRPIELTVKQKRSQRSTRQNAYWWGVVIPLLSEHLGYDKNEMHEALKYKFLRLDAEPDANGLVRMRGTSTLNTKEMTDLIEEVITWAGAEFGVVIPLPNEVLEATA
jgi:hypothetical protein